MRSSCLWKANLAKQAALRQASEKAWLREANSLFAREHVRVWDERLVCWPGPDRQLEDTRCCFVLPCSPV